MQRKPKKVRVESTRRKIHNALELHERMKKAYFFRPPGNAASRRAYEKHNSINFAFRFDGREYDVRMETECSCKNVYYRARILVDGSKKNITALKKII